MSNPTRPRWRAYAVATVLWILAFIVALKWGAVSDASIDVIAQLRLPRAILASAVGAGLAVAGAVLQALFSNPLCEPYTLGISSGSALGAVIGASLGLQWNYSGLAGTAFVGAFVFAGALYLLSLKPGIGNLGLLLAGVMLGLVGSSCVEVWMALSDANGIQGALIWLLGDLSRSRLPGAVSTLGGVTALSFVIWSRSGELDALLMGEEDAMALGVSVPVVRRRLVMLVSLLVGFCVSAAGMVGFVGLIIPHFSRRFVGSFHSALIPFCAIAGAAVMTAADAFARFAVRPYEIPVGVVTALVGAPVFLWIMLKKEGRA